MTRGFEPTHDLFSSSGMAVGRVDPVIQPLVGPVIGTAAIRAECHIVAPEFVGHRDARLTPLAHQLAEKPPGSSGISLFLNQNIQRITLIIDGAPQPVWLTADGDHHLIDMPLIACQRPITTNLRGLADRAYVLSDGAVVYDGSAAVLEADRERMEQLAGVSHHG